MNATPVDALKALQHPGDSGWGRIARRLAVATPSFDEDGNVDWKTLRVLFLAILTVIMMVAAIITIGEHLWSAATKQAIFNTSLLICFLASAWIVLGQILCAPWESLTPHQIKQVASIVAQPGREAWSETVAQWVRCGPLQVRHLRALQRAKQIEQNLTFETEEKRRHDEAMALLINGPVGAIVEQKRLERDTAPARGQPKAPERL